MSYHPRKYRYDHPGANEIEIDEEHGTGLLFTIVDGKRRRHYWTVRDVDLSITNIALVKIVASCPDPYFLLHLIAERMEQERNRK